MSRCVIGCMEPGCNNQIQYDSNDFCVHLYCPTHRSKFGRHAAVRNLQKETLVEIPPEVVITPDVIIVMRCPRCKLRREVSEKIWKKDAPIVCECGKSMVYHRTLGDEHNGKVRQ